MKIFQNPNKICHKISFNTAAWHYVNKQPRAEQNRAQTILCVLLVDYFVRSCDIKRQATTTHFMLMRLVYPVNLGEMSMNDLKLVFQFVSIK